MIELVELNVICQGRPRLRYFAWKKGDEIPVTEYIFGLPSQEQEKLLDMLGKIAVTGLPRNEIVYKKLHAYENLHELKKKPHRLLFFRLPGEDIVFTEAFGKSDSRRDDVHMQRADRRRREYQEQERTKRGEENRHG